MSFEVRTTPTGDGNSISAVAFADEYFADRGITAWTGTDSAKQSWLIQATDYIDIRFASRYTDEVLAGTSEFPLVDDDSTIPVKLARACCEYAIRAKGAPLAPDPTMDASGHSVVNTMKKIGPIEKQFAVVGPTTPALFRPYPAADALLIGLLKPVANRVYR